MTSSEPGWVLALWLAKGASLAGGLTCQDHMLHSLDSWTASTLHANSFLPLAAERKPAEIPGIPCQAPHAIQPTELPGSARGWPEALRELEAVPQWHLGSTKVDSFPVS